MPTARTDPELVTDTGWTPFGQIEVVQVIRQETPGRVEWRVRIGSEWLGTRRSRSAARATMETTCCDVTSFYGRVSERWPGIRIEHCAGACPRWDVSRPLHPPRSFSSLRSLMACLLEDKRSAPNSTDMVAP